MLTISLMFESYLEWGKKKEGKKEVGGSTKINATIVTQNEK